MNYLKHIILGLLSSTPKTTGTLYKESSHDDRTEVYNTLIELLDEKKISRTHGFEGKTLCFAWKLK